MPLAPRTAHPLSRRDFLIRLSYGAAAVALATRVRGEPEPTEKKLGIALVGLGKYSTGQLGPALGITRHCGLAGVVTGSPAKGRKWAQEHGFPEKNIYNYDTMD